MGNIQKRANLLARRLKVRGFVVHKYESVTTNSVYLKLDHGVCNSIRISDHVGKKHLQYRFNLLSDCPGFSLQRLPDGRWRAFYPPKEIEKLIEDVCQLRQIRIERYGESSYKRLMDENYRKG